MSKCEDCPDMTPHTPERKPVVVIDRSAKIVAQKIKRDQPTDIRDRQSTDWVNK